MKRIILFTAILLGFSGSQALAQFNLSDLSNVNIGDITTDGIDTLSQFEMDIDDLESFTVNEPPTIILSPRFPQPGEEFTATYNDFSDGSFGSNITWFVDGEVVSGSVNAREITLTAPPVGISETISVALSRPSGAIERVDYELSPYYVDIIFEPQTHSPDFYRGRSLPSFGSIVNTTAIVTDGAVVEQDLVYTWRVGREVIGNGPMRGRQSVSFEVPIDSRLVVSLEVGRPDGTIIAGTTEVIPSTQPYIQFYESNPLLGLGERPTSDPYNIVGNSVTLRATPFHLDSRVFNSPSLLEWSLGSSDFQDTGVNPYEITLERTGNTGRSTLQFHVRNTEQVLQGARGSIDIRL